MKDLPVQRKGIIEYLQGRIKELEKEAKESITHHGMPSWELHECNIRIGVLKMETEILANKGRKQRQKIEKNT